MGIFALRSSTVPSARSLPDPVWLEHAWAGLPPRFEAVAEALAAGSDSVEACAVVGAQSAKDGTSLDETLEALATTYQIVTGRYPDYGDVRAIARSWSDATLAYLHQLACEDPLTGLASLAHVRSRLSELYRGELRGSARVRESHALVVAELHPDRHLDPPESFRAKHVLTRSMRLSALGDTARTVFSGTETVGLLGPDRVVVIVERDDRLGQRVALLRRMCRTVDSGDASPRVWIEGLPSTDSVAAMLLDELSRT